MKKKTVVIIIGIAIMLFIAIGMIMGGITILKGMQRENEKIKQNIEEIEILYKELNENATSFNEQKEKYDTLMASTYYTNAYERNSSILKELQVYDEIIGKIITTGNELEERCSITYSDSDTYQKCNSYKISYESAMQVFKADVKRYNTLVENYTIWLKENPNYKKIEIFTSKYVK